MVIKPIRFMIPFSVLLISLPGAASAQSIDPSFYYRLSTQFRGDGMKLDVFNGGPKNNLTRLEPDQNVSGQFWRFTGNGDGSFRLTTLFRGRIFAWISSTAGRETISLTSPPVPTYLGSFGSFTRTAMQSASRRDSAVLTCAWTSSTGGRTTTSPTWPLAATSRDSFGR
jgi:hypothetical protein